MDAVIGEEHPKIKGFRNWKSKKLISLPFHKLIITFDLIIKMTFV